MLPTALYSAKSSRRLLLMLSVLLVLFYVFASQAQGCITNSWLLRGKQCLGVPVPLPRVFEKDAAPRQEQVQLRHIPAQAWPFAPGSGELLAGALKRSRTNRVLSQCAQNSQDSVMHPPTYRACLTNLIDISIRDSLQGRDNYGEKGSVNRTATGAKRRATARCGASASRAL